MRATTACIRYLLFVFNLVFVICGLVLVVVGVVSTKKDYTEFLNSKFVTAPIICIVVGCIIFVVAFFGCCGALKYNYYMVLTFALLIIAIIVIELSGAVFAFIYRGQVQEFLKESMNTSLSQQRKEAVRIWNEMQSTWECCGVDSAEDYENLKLKIPRSCCKKKMCPRRHICPDKCPMSEAWKEGCFPTLLQKIKDSNAVIGCIVVGIALVEFLGCIFSVYLANAIKKDED
ncbi:23 kDa integral membrane protein-like [Parasteatoda tepidariorum]|uniref:23 kDa integral membrane protein-like n=1 Tax=Parasteatoda tepidariorum TaxID=114398 RepID=UPI00077FD609|nr:23 kDa integral membrane protein-like [Parasteatoda tepidariorum]